MAAWPASLPQTILMSGYESEWQSGVVRVDPDSGPSEQRRRFTALTETIIGQMNMTLTQWNTARAFYKDTLGDGALSFTWIHPVTQVAINARFIASDGKALAILRSLRSDLFLVSLKYEVLP